MCAACVPSRQGRSPTPRGSSSLLPHQIDENVLERALRRLQIGKSNPRAGKVVEQSGDAGRRSAAGIVIVGQLAAVCAERKVMLCECGWDCGQRLLQLQDELLLAELAHQFGLVLDQDDLAFVD